MEKERTKTRVWMPRNFRKFGNWAFGTATVPGINSNNQAENTARSSEYVQEVERKNSKAKNKDGKKCKGNQQVRDRRGKALTAFYGWFTNSQGAFALRVTIVSFALALPAVFPTSSSFYYNEKGSCSHLLHT